MERNGLIFTSKSLYISIFFIYVKEKVKLQKGNFTMEEEVICFIERRVTKFGTGIKIDCPKEYVGKRESVQVLKE